jgi:hypothetical protein
MLSSQPEYALQNNRQRVLGLGADGIWDECGSLSLDERSLNINTFPSAYVLMGYTLPEEAQCPAVHRAGTA